MSKNQSESIKKPPCTRHGAYDCRTNYVGYCTALSDTDFGEKQCPFYKTSGQYYGELNELKNYKKNKRLQDK